MQEKIKEKVVQETLIQKNVGMKIKHLRGVKKLNTVTLATKAGISQGQLSKIENGKATISIKNLTKLCNALETPLSCLFETEDKQTTQQHTINAVAGLENRGLHWFAGEILDFTDGAVALKPLGPFQFGTAYEQINYGFKENLDLFVEEIEYCESISPELRHLILPYCFRNEENRRAFFKSDYFMKKVINRLLKNGIRVLNPNWNWRRGMERVLLSRTPLISPHDVKGLRVRVNESEILSEVWKDMGAVPVKVPWPDVKEALKYKEVDLLPTRKALLFHNGFCEYAKYITLLGDIPSILGVFISEKKFRSFPRDIQESLANACDSTGEIFTHNVALLELKNEKSNLSCYGAAYLKVDLLPWKRKMFEIRTKMMDRGRLSKKTWREIETSRQ